MPKRKYDGPRVPDVVICGGCKRRLDPEVYSWPSAIPKDTPEDRITRSIQPTYPRFTVFCTCGHFTAFVPNERWLKYT